MGGNKKKLSLAFTTIIFQAQASVSHPQCNYCLGIIAKVNKLTNKTLKNLRRIFWNFLERLWSTRLLAGCTRTARKANLETKATIYHDWLQRSHKNNDNVCLNR